MKSLTLDLFHLFLNVRNLKILFWFFVRDINPYTTLEKRPRIDKKTRVAFLPTPGSVSNF